VVVIRFWKRAGYVPLYIRQTTSELTGEHACVMVRGLNSSVENEMEWLSEFAQGLLELHPFLRLSVTNVYAHLFQTFEDGLFRCCRTSSGSLAA
jgi:tRNA(Met) C34 N-acetyltransferase TmcA